MNKKLKDSFSKTYDLNKNRKDISNASLAFIIPGFVLFLVFTLKGLVSVNLEMYIYYTLSGVSFILILLGTLFPKHLIPITTFLSNITNKIAVYIIKLALVLVYLLMFVFTFVFSNVYARNYQFIKWENDAPMQSTYFVKEKSIAPNNKKYFFVLSNIISGLLTYKLFFLIPFVFILLLIGLVFFFVTSSTVFSFIYTFL